MPSSYNLGEHLEKFAAGQVASDRYSSASEGIRADLRLLNDQERERNARPEALRAQIQVGLGDWENGRYVEFETKEELEAFFEEIAEQGMRRLRAHALD
ncbi:MAG TPA: type II toxin-antitoxin system ParD family antitoxin [Alphaproteobacteria bacterium]|jgi:antitoxin ParD1/3/4|nr:type II toxin-antitoxin system ParD family antitoxin [Alphaproteobacteria bacterium]